MMFQPAKLLFIAVTTLSAMQCFRPEDARAQAVAATVRTQPVSAPRSSAVHSAYFYQPRAGHLATEVGLAVQPDTSASEEATSTGGVSATALSRSQRFFVSNQYGWYDGWSFGYRLSYTESAAPTTVDGGATSALTSRGFDDLELNLKKRLRFNLWNLYFGLNIFDSIGSSEIATSVTQGNQSTGGWSAEPALGFLVFSGHEWSYGANLQYRYYSDRNQVIESVPSQNQILTGGDRISLDGIVEWYLPQSTVAMVAGLVSRSNINSSIGQSTSETLTPHALVVYDSRLVNRLVALTWKNSLDISFVPEHDVSTTERLGAATVYLLTTSIRIE